MMVLSLDKRLLSISERLKAVSSPGIRVDFDSFPEEEKLLLLRAGELEEADLSPALPKKVVDENHKLVCKFFEIVAKASCGTVC